MVRAQFLGVGGSSCSLSKMLLCQGREALLYVPRSQRWVHVSCRTMVTMPAQLSLEEDGSCAPGRVRLLCWYFFEKSEIVVLDVSNLKRTRCLSVGRWWYVLHKNPQTGTINTYTVRYTYNRPSTLNECVYHYLYLHVLVGTRTVCSLWQCVSGASICRTFHVPRGCLQEKGDFYTTFEGW